MAEAVNMEKREQEMGRVVCQDDPDLLMNVSLLSGDDTQHTSTLTQPGTSSSNQGKQKRKQCTLCPYSSLFAGNLRRHVSAIHSKIKTHACELCPKMFSVKYYLDEHMRSRHQQGPQLLCEFCSKVFPSKKTLHTHKRHKHLFADSYKCEFCDRTFSQKDHYTGHVNTHTSLKPYSCPNCPKSFAYKNSLKRHMAESNCREDDADSVPVYSCDQCGKVMPSITALKQHITGVHGPKNYICMCGTAYSWRTGLFRHKKKCKVWNNKN